MLDMGDKRLFRSVSRNSRDNLSDRSYRSTSKLRNVNDTPKSLRSRKANKFMKPANDNKVPFQQRFRNIARPVDGSGSVVLDLS